MRVGQAAMFKRDGQVGRLVEVLNGETLAVFESRTGARFTVRADEVELLGSVYAPAVVAAARERARHTAELARALNRGAARPAGCEGRVLYRLERAPKKPARVHVPKGEAGEAATLRAFLAAGSTP